MPMLRMCASAAASDSLTGVKLAAPRRPPAQPLLSAPRLSGPAGAARDARGVTAPMPPRLSTQAGPKVDPRSPRPCGRCAIARSVGVDAGDARRAPAQLKRAHFS
eukprot:357012-Chlamydomonas_euryale.AAC.5